MAPSTVHVSWIASHLMTGVDSGGQTITIGSWPGREPAWTGVKPSDLLLLAAASCSLYDVAMILDKQKQPLEGLEVACRGEQADEAPYAFSSVHLTYRVRGAVDPKKLERAIRLSEEKYCSVLNTLKPRVEVTSSYELAGDA